MTATKPFVWPKEWKFWPTEGAFCHDWSSRTVDHGVLVVLKMPSGELAERHVKSFGEMNDAILGELHDLPRDGVRYMILPANLGCDGCKRKAEWYSMLPSIMVISI
jgi:hypothetical protein